MVKQSNSKQMKKGRSWMGRTFAGAAALVTVGAIVYSVWYKYSTRPISLEEIKSYSGVETIVGYNADIPKNIVILQNHPNQNTVFRNVNEKRLDMGPTLEIFDKLYRRGVRDIIIEGMDQSRVKEYNRNKKIRIKNVITSDESIEYWRSFEHLLNSHHWRIHAGERREIFNDADVLLAPFNREEEKIISNLRSSLKKLFNPYKGWTISNQERNMLQSQYSNLVSGANINISNLVVSFFTPEIHTNLFDILVNQRDKQISLAAKETSGQTAILIGSGHQFTLTNRLDGN